MIASRDPGESLKNELVFELGLDLINTNKYQYTWKPGGGNASLTKGLERVRIGDRNQRNNCEELYVIVYFARNTSLKR